MHACCRKKCHKTYVRKTGKLSEHTTIEGAGRSLETSTVFVANFYCKVGIMDNLFICIKAVNTYFDTTAKYHCSSFVATIVPPPATDFGGFTKKGNVVFH